LDCFLNVPRLYQTFLGPIKSKSLFAKVLPQELVMRDTANMLSAVEERAWAAPVLGRAQPAPLVVDRKALPAPRPTEGMSWTTFFVRVYRLSSSVAAAEELVRVQRW